MPEPRYGISRPTTPRTGLVISYCLGWLRQVENHYLVIALDLARTFPKRPQAVTDTLVSDRVDPETIVKALVTMAIEAGWKSRRPEAVFDVGEKAFSNAAYEAFEQAKKD